MSTLSALGTLSQLTQLQGCTGSNLFLFSAVDVVPAESQFAIKVVVTWLLLFVGYYGVYLNASPGKASGNFEPMDEDTDELDSMGGITCMDGMSSVESSSGDFDSDEGGVEIVEGHPAFSPEGLLHLLYGRSHVVNF